MTDYIRGSSSPPQSLGLQLRVLAGRNQIQKQLGNFGALYDATGASMQETYFELEPGQTWASNPQETIQQLVVSTSGPVTLAGVRPSAVSLSLPVNKMAVIDSELSTFTITNNGLERVRGNLNFVSKPAVVG